MTSFQLLSSALSWQWISHIRTDCTPQNLYIESSSSILLGTIPELPV